ncbi:sugar-binding transcriptional regulator [Actinomycetota bacterium]
MARLLDAARADGLVRIEIVPVGRIDAELSAVVRERYSLDEAVVVDTEGLDVHDARQELGKVAGDLLTETLKPGQTLGLPWSRGVYAMSTSLMALPQVDVVQLTGAMQNAELDSSAVDIVRRVARVSGGTAYLFFAPFVLEDAAAAEMVRRQPPVAQARAKTKQVDVALVGVGAWEKGGSTLYAAATPAERREATSLGAVGEMSGVFYDADGAVVRPGLVERLVTLSGEELAGIPTVIGIASGADRARTVLAALRGGLLRGLVCDAALARALLDHDDRRA